jgi:hypothetical protein
MANMRFSLWWIMVGSPPPSCLYRTSVMIKTLYCPTDAQIYNS